MAPKVLTVMGATGAQGSSIIQRLKGNSEWKLRAVTRNPSSDSAEALSSSGVEVVTADSEDVNSLIKAFSGSHAVFGLTNFWEGLYAITREQAGENEHRHAMNIAIAASKTESLEHFIWATLPSATKLTDGKGPVTHFDRKAEVNDYIQKELPQLAKKTTYLYCGWYAMNVLNLPMFDPVFIPRGGVYYWMQPCGPQTMIPCAGDVVKNLGIFVEAILNHPERSFGKAVNAVTECLPFEEIVKLWSDAVGKPATYVEISEKHYNETWGIYGEEMTQQFKFHEIMPDWTSGSDSISAKEIGVDESELVGSKAYWETVKDTWA